MNTAPAEIASSVLDSGPVSSCGIAARGVEEHEIGRRVVEEARQDAGRPEVHRVDRLAVSVDRLDDRRERARGAGAQDRDRRDDGQEDAGEQLGDLDDREPAELVGLARRVAASATRRHSGDQQQQHVAHDVLQLERDVVDRRR